MSSTNQPNEVRGMSDHEMDEINAEIRRQHNSVRVCQRGVDGSPGCGHERPYSSFEDRHCHFIVDWPTTRTCGHACDLSVRVPDERHEFVKPAETSAKPDFICAVSGCNQRREAACHAVEPPKECDSCHHSGPRNDAGTCLVDVRHLVDPEGPFRGQTTCGCQCTFCPGCGGVGRRPRCLDCGVSSTQPDVAKPPAMSRVDYLLSHLAQECCEVAIRCTKAQMFGLDEIQPEQEFTNRERMFHELCDVLATVETMKDEGIWPDVGLFFPETLERIKTKKIKAANFSDYSRQLGRLEP